MKLSRAVAVTLLAMLFGQTSNCQVNIPNFDLLRQQNDAVKCMVQYRKEHEHLPSLQPELDEALVKAYCAINEDVPRSVVVPQSEGIYRTYANVAITYDIGIRGLTRVNGKIKPPSSWVAKPNSVVIVSDGQDRFVVWLASCDGHPMCDPTDTSRLRIVVRDFSSDSESEAK